MILMSFGHMLLDNSLAPFWILVSCNHMNDSQLVGNMCSWVDDLRNKQSIDLVQIVGGQQVVNLCRSRCIFCLRTFNVSCICTTYFGTSSCFALYAAMQFILAICIVGDQCKRYLFEGASHSYNVCSFASYAIK